MTKLEPGFGFTGAINNISAYKMRGFDKIINKYPLNERRSTR
jgi:hypothetical protein